MIDRYLPGLPYELIGQAVVILVLVVLGLLALAVLILAALVVWCRGWAWLSNRMYKGYKINPKEERPPLWRMRVSAVALALSRLEFRKILPAYREAETLTADDTTFHQYLKRVFLSD